MRQRYPDSIRQEVRRWNRRHRALPWYGWASSGLPWYGWASGSAIAAGVLLGVFVYQQPAELPAYVDPVHQELAENMELLEDMEFMAWIILQEEEASDQNATTSS